MPVLTEENESTNQPPRIGELLKESPVRTVIRAPRKGGGSLIVKTYRARGLLERLRAIWLRSRALVEASNLSEARRRGLPCPAPLSAAAGRGVSPSEGWLALEDLGEGTTVGRAVRERPAAAAALCAAAGRLIADACARGLDGRDWHLDNLFVDTTDALHLIDLQKVRFRSGPVRPRPARLRGLWLGLPWPHQARLRAALLAPLGQPATPGELTRLLVRHLELRLRRCLRSSGPFVRERDTDGRWFLRRRFFDPQHGPDDWQRQLAAGEVIKSGRRGRVVRCSLDHRQGSARHAEVRPTGCHGTGQRASEHPSPATNPDAVADPALRAGMCTGKLRGEAAALALWRAAFALELRGVAAPRALAFFAASPGRAWVLSEDLAAAVPLSRIAAAPFAERARVTASLAEAMARLHATGWRCRDPKGDNLAALDGRAVFLDLDGIRPLPRWRRQRACASDLSRLLAWARWQAPATPAGGWPAIERRFLARYLRTRQAITGRRIDRARFVAAIERSAARWRRRHAENGFAE